MFTFYISSNVVFFPHWSHQDTDEFFNLYKIFGRYTCVANLNRRNDSFLEWKESLILHPFHDLIERSCCIFFCSPSIISLLYLLGHRILTEHFLSRGVSDQSSSHYSYFVSCETSNINSYETTTTQWDKDLGKKKEIVVFSDIGLIYV